MNKLNWHSVFQPIYKVDQNMTPHVVHYEMLLRDENNRFPVKDFFTAISNEESNLYWIKVEERDLDKLFSRFPNAIISLNIEPIQFAYESVWDFLHRIYAKYGNHIIIEVTERQLQAGVLAINHLDLSFNRIKDIGFKISLDDICSGSNSFQFVAHHLNKISCIKLSLLIFDGTPKDITIQFIKAWIAFAKKNNLTLVVEAVRSKEIAQLLAGKDFILQQGYYWEKPLEMAQL
ncbi:MAG: EAL domain-containing protein [Lactobacillus sp.]